MCGSDMRPNRRLYRVHVKHERDGPLIRYFGRNGDVERDLSTTSGADRMDLDLLQSHQIN
jgi:hypothetical protein